MDYKKYLEIAGNVHLAYYIQAADKLGIKYEIIIPRMTAKFSSDKYHWFINVTANPLTSAPSARLARTKNLTNKVLSLANIPVPKQIKAETIEEALQFFENEKDIVLKPAQNLGGHGISILPQTKEEVIEAFKEAQNNDRHQRVLIEKFIQGDNYRFLVVGDNVVSVVRRLPAHITGNGINTILELIDIENNNRKLKGLLPIPLDEETQRQIEKQGYNDNTIIENGLTIFVRKNTNLTTGGTTEECLQEVNPYYLEIAINAVKALDMKFGGVDLIAKDITKPGDCAINEINYNPGLRLHYKVDKGEPVDVAYHIIKYINELYKKINN